MNRADLLVVVPDRDIEAAVQGVLSQPHKLGIRKVSSKTILHVQRDSGCYREGVAFLRERRESFQHGLLIFDHAGCGRETEPRETIELDLERGFQSSGWGDRAAAIVISPEVEAWVWSDSSEVDRALGWQARTPELRTWIRKQGIEMKGPKPIDPKAALHAALREARQQPSPHRFRSLAERVSFRRCIDPAFQKLERVLRRWFDSSQGAVR